MNKLSLVLAVVAVLIAGLALSQSFHAPVEPTKDTTLGGTNCQDTTCIEGGLFVTTGILAVGSSTPPTDGTDLYVGGGATATTTSDLANQSASAKACINMRTNLGAAVSAYIVGTSWVIEAGRCR